MNDFRNRFVRRSVVLLAGAFLAVLPLSRAAAAGIFVGGAANLIVQLGRVRAIRLAGDSAEGIKYNLTTWGILRWAVYAAVFCIGYRIGGGQTAGVAGAAAGLLIPLAVMIYTGATETAAEIDTNERTAT
jgi:hypothetical protein